MSIFRTEIAPLMERAESIINLTAHFRWQLIRTPRERALVHTVTLVISSRETINRRFFRSFEGEPQGTLSSFESPALLFKVLTGKRWELLKLTTGAGPIAIREAARRLGRDMKAVHSDVHALLNAGILEKTDNGRIHFAFDAVHVDFTLKAA
jgi:predicted transcriptional regulator